MKAQKTAIFITFALAFGAACPLLAQTGAQTAQAEEPVSATQITAENASLFLPRSYEEYLPLTAPSHAAFSEEYIAVADGANLFLYDRAAKEYSVYEHKTGTPANPTVLAELQFAPDGTLFFTDQSTTLYTFDPATAAVAEQKISCSTFLINNNSIYYATTTTGTTQVTFYYVPLAAPETERRTLIGSFTGANPHLAYENGLLHCIVNDNSRTVYDTTDGHKIVAPNKFLDNTTAQISGLRYVCAYGKSLYYTVSGNPDESLNGLYRADGDGNSQTSDGTGKSRPALAGNGMTTLAVFHDKLYCVQGSAVKEIDVSGNQPVFTGYEIAAASSSPNRFSSAVDCVRAGDLLVSADAGNGRVSIYHLKTGAFQTVPCEGVKLVATDGNTVAMSNGRTVFWFEYGHSDKIEQTTPESGEIVGLACFFSEIYYVTQNDIYGKVGGDRPPVTRSYGTPTSLACDLYGTLYVSYHTGAVYAFGFEEFLTNGGKEAHARFETVPEVLRADFEGNLYYLADGNLYKNGAPFATFPQDKPLVYRGETKPVSFALGYEDDGVYFSFGDYALVTCENALPVPTLAKISLENAKEQIYATGDAQSLLVDVAENSVGIDVDLSALNASERYFPYAGYSRIPAVRGVKIALVDRYALVLVENGGVYKALLLRAERVTPVSPEEYYEQAETNAYLSNTVNACYFPCMEQALAEDRPQRGTAVKQLAIITLPERKYALVTYRTERGETAAYVPLSYLSPVDPLGVPDENYVLGALKRGETVFAGSDGSFLTVTERTQVRLYRQADGAYTVRFEKDGVIYTAQDVSADMVESGNSDALRTSLIVILSVLAVLIVGIYIYFLPVGKRKIK